jgi:hypothetical protein
MLAISLMRSADAASGTSNNRKLKIGKNRFITLLLEGIG